MRTTTLANVRVIEMEELERFLRQVYGKDYDVFQALGFPRGEYWRLFDLTEPRSSASGVKAIEGWLGDDGWLWPRLDVLLHNLAVRNLLDSAHYLVHAP